MFEYVDMVVFLYVTRHVPLPCAGGSCVVLMLIIKHMHYFEFLLTQSKKTENG